jgi:hypothetical protein
LQGLSGHRVERAERLIHQQQLWILCQTACNLHALLHTAGQLVRKLIFAWLKLILASSSAIMDVLLCGGDIPSFQAKRHVAAHGAPGQ